jgi:hypothetical protein
VNNEEGYLSLEREESCFSFVSCGEQQKERDFILNRGMATIAGMTFFMIAKSGE